MPYLLDTNIVIHARDGLAAVLDKLAAYPGDTFVSALTLVELWRGVHKRPAEAAVRQARLRIILEEVVVIDFDHSAADAYGEIIAQLGWVRGRDFDRMIAAHAISVGATLVTANEADFRDIPGLAIENWALTP